MNKFTFDGSWTEIKGKLRQKYAQLTENDLQFAEGKGEEFLGTLKARLGVGAEQLQKTLSDLKLEVEEAAQSVPGKYEAAKQKVSDVAHDVTAKVSEKAEDLYEGACEKACAWNDESEAYIRKQPRTAVLTGLVAGFLIGLLVRR